MAKLATKAHSKTHRIIIYGAPKTGKTQLAGELAEHGYNMFWVDMENGHETLFKLSQEAQQRIELINLPYTRSYPIAIETCLKMVKATKAINICDTHGKVSCITCTKDAASMTTYDPSALGPEDIVVFDSLTQLTNSAIANITRGKPDDYKLEYDDWGNLGKLMDIFLSHIQQAKYNVIVISHETEADFEDKKKQLVPVGGTRNFSRNVAKYFDHVIYAQRKNRKHVFASSSTFQNGILTGSRTDAVLEEDDGNASLLKIFRLEEAVSNNSSDEERSKSILNKLGRK